MELFDALKFEIKKTWRGMLIFGGVVGLFISLELGFYDPILFESLEEILASLPPEILALLGNQVNFGTFEGFANVYLFGFAWLWWGLYLILKVAQDIPGEMENKTIDLVLSKPIRRWEYVLSKQIQHIVTIIVALLIGFLFTLSVIAFNPHIIFADVHYNRLILSFVWTAILLITIESNVLLISTIFRRRIATAIGFAFVMIMWFIPAFSANIPIDNIEYISFFNYFETSSLMIDGLMTNVVRDMLILVGWSISMSAGAIIIFSKRDLPV